MIWTVIWFILFSLSVAFLLFTALAGTRFYSLYTGKTDILAIKVVAWLAFLYIIAFVGFSTFVEKGVNETVVETVENSQEVVGMEEEESIQDDQLHGE